MTSLGLVNDKCAEVSGQKVGGYVYGTIIPGVVDMPGDLSVYFYANLSRPIVNGMKMKITIEHSVVWWQTYYDQEVDACAYLLKNCPQSFEKNGIPCRCPIPAGVYEHQLSRVAFVPDLLPDLYMVTKQGMYWLKVSILEPKKNATDPDVLFACQEIYFELRPTY